ncbi:MAG: response regulator [Geopsychrobacter sp.]|nr:response regulator [Geopsychrobacter sp.]
MLNELILILTQFGGGPGDPANNAVRFLLAGFFWSVLYIISYRLWRETTDRRHLLFSIAAVVGASRELFMFVSEYGSFRGYFAFDTIFKYYPPIEHAVAILSIILMGYAFLRVYFNFEKFAHYFLIVSSTVTLITYLVISPLWISFLKIQTAAGLEGAAYIGAQFHDFPGDLIFRLEGALITLLILGAFLYAKKRDISIPWLAFVAFFFFFADDALQAINDLAGDIYAPIFAPIRHNLHILAIILLVGAYWWEVTRRLKRQTRFLNTLLDAIPDLIAYKDRQNRYLGCNRNYAQTLTGRAKDQLIGQQEDKILAAQNQGHRSQQIDQEVIATNKYRTLEQTCTLADGRQALFETIKTPFHDADGRVAGVIDISRDITARRELEEQLLHSQKLDAIGQLAGGVAHDFNNILAVIQGYVSIMQNKTTPEHPFYNYLNKSNDPTERAASLTKNLMVFSRKQAMSADSYDLNEIMINCKEFLQRLIPEDIDFQLHCATTLLSVYVDKHQIEQALTNLVANARDAMPKGGTLSITTSVCERDESFVRAQGFGKPGIYAQICVKDNGCGMDDALRRRIFEPFFTTKDIGKGTGLGLAMVYGIIKQNSGYVTVTSQPQQGSTFMIDLPIVQHQQPSTKKTNAPIMPGQGQETILIVEDETDLREMAQTALQQFGYQVIQAVNGQDAVEKFHIHQHQINLVLMDVVMPVMNGKDAATEIRRHRPDIKILFTSGYTMDIIQSRGELDPDEDLLTKPVKPTLLLQKIRQMLDQTPQ